MPTIRLGIEAHWCALRFESCEAGRGSRVQNRKSSSAYSSGIEKDSRYSNGLVRVRCPRWLIAAYGTVLALRWTTATPLSRIPLDDAWTATMTGSSDGPEP